MSEVIFNTEEIIEVSAATLEDLKRRASEAPRRRFRLCLHRSPAEQVQEMVIVFCGDTYIRPHRHPRGKSESYHIIEGELTVFLFDDLGNVIRRVEMGEHDSDGSFLYRLASDIWHMPVPRSEFVVFHETFTGPFRRGLDVEHPGWSPEETDTAGIVSLLRRILGE